MAQLTQRRYSNIANNLAEDTVSLIPTQSIAITGGTFSQNRPAGESGGISYGINANQESYLNQFGINLIYPTYTSANANSVASEYFFTKLYSPNERGISTNTVTGSGSDFTYADYLLTQIGRELDLTASSVGSPNYKAAKAGAQTVADFYGATGSYGSLVTVGGGYDSADIGSTYARKAPLTSGVMPSDWNKDINGNPLPWGTRRASDGNVYTTTSGASVALPAPSVSYLKSSTGTVAYVANWNTSIPKSYSSPTYSIGKSTTNYSKVYHQ